MVIMCLIDDFKFDFVKVNINGGVCVLGYFVGLIGFCIIFILIYVFKCMGGKKGIVVLCIGGGEVIVVVIELF